MLLSPSLAAESPWSFGVAALTQNQVYRGADSEFRVFPLLQYEGERFSIRGVTVGYRVFRNESSQLALTLRPDFDGFESDDSKFLAGMKEREMTALAGVEASHRIGIINISASLAQDILDRHGGYEAEIGLGTRLPLRGKVWLMPGIGLKWLSSDKANYIYGVNIDEVIPGRAFYQPGSVNIATASLGISYEMSENWQTFVMVSVDRLESSISDSPIVDGSTQNSVLGTLTYRF